MFKMPLKHIHSVNETQIYTRYTQPRGAARSMGHRTVAIRGYEEQASHNIKIIKTHIIKCALPENGPVRPKHVAPNIECIYF
jgi:hypothetical protein